MSQYVTYTNCPACGAAPLQPVFACQDWLVSKQYFNIEQCPQCSLRITQQVPDAHAIGPFYDHPQYISHTDADTGLINRLYKMVRQITLAQKRKNLKSWLQHVPAGPQGPRLLDIGCGTGAFLHTMQQAGWQVTGIEPDAGARNRAISQYNLTVHPASQLDTLPAQHFEVITFWHVMEHIHNLQHYWQQIRRLLIPGGLLVIAVPNYTSADAAHYGALWAAYDVPRHLYHFSPMSMQQLAASHGFEFLTQKPMWFDAWYIALLSEKCKGGGGQLPKAVWQGLKCTWATLGHRQQSSSITYVFRRGA
ncbi:MAG TPA: class I SAM-dependent methyltransferase [Phnomibacter sp.]|nr:class I SAM-dependent methyltransferase [Phnomibacter sp.]